MMFILLYPFSVHFKLFIRDLISQGSEEYDSCVEFVMCPIVVMVLLYIHVQRVRKRNFDIIDQIRKFIFVSDGASRMVNVLSGCFPFCG